MPEPTTTTPVEPAMPPAATPGNQGVSAPAPAEGGDDVSPPDEGSAKG